MPTQKRILAARDVLLAGDQPALVALLDAEPELIFERVGSTLRPYDGYFHGAILLHHVAANPLIIPLPENIVGMTELLLERGAEVDTPTLPGPCQPNDIGWTALGLVATSAEARTAGVQRRLMDTLLAAGADPDARNGGCLMGALYYREEDAAEYLAKRGARLDLVAAAGLGALDRVREHLATDLSATAAAPAGPDQVDAPRLVHYSLVPWPSGATADDLVGLALVYAALHGRTEVIRVLLETGIDPDHRPPFDHYGTALHWAVMGDQPEAVQRLAARGADLQARDRSFGSTPAGWAQHLGRPAAAAALRELGAEP